MTITYEKFIKKIKRKGETIENIFQKPGLIKNDLINRVRLEVSTTGWPNYRTGNLFRSIQAEERVTRTGSEIAITAGNGIRYAPYVEFGTRRIRPRFYLNRAIYNWQKGNPVGAGVPGTTPFEVSGKMADNDADYKFMSEILKDFLQVD